MAANGPSAPSLADLQYQYFAGLPPGGTILQVGATGAASASNAALPAVAGKTNYITGFDVYGVGATAGSVILITITGLAGGTITIPYTVPTGATTGATPLTVRFPYPIPASAVNTAITVNVPSFGAGSTNQAAVAYGFVL